MEKPKHTPITDYNKPKKTPTNFVRSTTGNLPDKKTKAATNNPTKKPLGWIKKQDESWDY